MNEITLSEFVVEQQKALAAFEAWWLAQMLAAPDNSPAAMLPGDWDEQFESFQECRSALTPRGSARCR